MKRNVRMTLSCFAALTLSLFSAGAVHASDAWRPLSAHHVVADGIPLAVWQKSPASPRRAVLLIHGRMLGWHRRYFTQVSFAPWRSLDVA